MNGRVFHTETGGSPRGDGWHELLQEATDALVRMDADRLEELVRCCEDLNRQQQASPRKVATALANRATVRQMQEELASLAVMGRLLEETRANLRVLTHLHVLRLKEAAGDAEKWSAWRHSASGAAGVGYGDN